jgi:hypothetical protein
MKFNTLHCYNASFKLNANDLLNLRQKTALDLSFQSSARWSPETKVAYVTSLVTGMAPSKIILCNIEKCLNNLIEGCEDWKYFKAWQEKGYEWISIDGNNRTITINEFLKGEVPIQHGDYILPNGASIHIDKSNDNYNTFPKILRKHVDENVQVSFAAYSNATRYDMTQLFLNINDGVSLNSQEKLNAILVPFSGWVRDRVEEYHPVLKKVFPTEKQLVRRAVDDYIVSMAIFATFDTQKSIQLGEKKKAYEDDSAVSRSVKRAEKLIKETLRFVKKYDVQNNMKNSSTLFNLYMLVTHIQDNNMNVVDEAGFYSWFLATENRLVGNDTPIMTTAGGESRTYSSCNSTMSAPELTARKDSLLREFNKVDCLGKLVVRKDEERFFTPTQKYKLWEKQGGVCPQTGKTIPESEINNHKKWQADHVVPHDLGGKTTIENGQLVCAEYNNKKGNRWSDEPSATFA